MAPTASAISSARSTSGESFDSYRKNALREDRKPVRLSLELLSKQIYHLLSVPRLRNAHDVGYRLEGEIGAERYCKSIHQWIGCDGCPILMRHIRR